MPGFRYRNDGLRTDGREVRPHTPWRLNPGGGGLKTGSLTNISAPKTDFTSQLAPRLSGAMQPRLGGLMARSDGRTPMPGGGLAPAEASTPVLLTGSDSVFSPLSVPADTMPAPMFANVSDEGATPTAPRPPMALGAIPTTGANLKNRYGTASVSFRPQNRMALGGRRSDLPY